MLGLIMLTMMFVLALYGLPLMGGYIVIILLQNIKAS